MTRIGFSLALVALAGMTGWARAEDLIGTWQRGDGALKVEFEICGNSLCGSIVWLRPGEMTKAQIGQRIFYDMRASGRNAWDGKVSGSGASVFTGQLSINGPDLNVSVCLPGGLICKSSAWKRAS